MQRLLASLLRPVTVAGLAGAALAAACSSTQGSAPTGPRGAGFVEPSEQLARQIELKAVECEFWNTEEEFVGLCDWFYEVGEPSYESLLDMAAGPSMRARFVAMSAFAIIGDRRLVQRFRGEVPVPDDPSLRMSYARALIQMGDFSDVPVLIAGLHDPNPRNRAMAHQSLERATNNDVPFNAAGSREEREKTASIWRRWFAARTDDPLLRAELRAEDDPVTDRGSEGSAPRVVPPGEDGSTN
ncbi:MAG: hypothetical protein VXZ39_02135 [Planctomycetota bacterium]|nr:hypothetical protein [Planctomycetota bacterium]MEC8493690.1 hypothetical protein [Planctomycetota bacterium]MEE2941567.1 hypothetical protein [Planctomycetota bacterium]